MTSQTKKHVAFRRKREGKTDYKRRRLLLTSQEIRLVVRKSLKHTTCQLVAYSPQGDKVLLTIHSSALKKLGWTGNTGNIPAAYLTGYLLGKKAQEKNITQAILDTGLATNIKGNRIYAAAKGAKDAGLAIALQEDIAGDETRLHGQHIAAYATVLKEKQQVDKVFTTSKNPEQVPALVETIKKKIMG